MMMTTPKQDNLGNQDKHKLKREINPKNTHQLPMKTVITTTCLEQAILITPVL